MRDYRFRIVNVFAETTLGGNPLCVFEDGRGLDDATMQALALQFNLSETTFILPAHPHIAAAQVRIFTPTLELPFAGHPTLGSAHVVRALQQTGDHITLAMKAGLIPVSAQGNHWTFTASAPQSRPCEQDNSALATMLNLEREDIDQQALWVKTGVEQLIIPLTTTEAVRRARPNPERLALLSNDMARSMAYVFAPNGPGKLLSRFFFLKHGSIVEDPGTGSATANLGGWLLAMKKSLPLRLNIEQGEATGRPCHLGLRVEMNGNIYVSGNVVEIGRGNITLPHHIAD